MMYRKIKLALLIILASVWMPLVAVSASFSAPFPQRAFVFDEKGQPQDIKADEAFEIGDGWEIKTGQTDLVLCMPSSEVLLRCNTDFIIAGTDPVSLSFKLLFGACEIKALSPDSLIVAEIPSSSFTFIRGGLLGLIYTGSTQKAYAKDTSVIFLNSQAKGNNIISDSFCVDLLSPGSAPYALELDEFREEEIRAACLFEVQAWGTRLSVMFYGGKAEATVEEEKNEGFASKLANFAINGGFFAREGMKVLSMGKDFLKLGVPEDTTMEDLFKLIQNAYEKFSQEPPMQGIFRGFLLGEEIQAKVGPGEAVLLKKIALSQEELEELANFLEEETANTPFTLVLEENKTALTYPQETEFEEVSSFLGKAFSSINAQYANKKYNEENILPSSQALQEEKNEIVKQAPVKESEQENNVSEIASSPVSEEASFASENQTGEEAEKTVENLSSPSLAPEAQDEARAVLRPAPAKAKKETVWNFGLKIQASPLIWNHGYSGRLKTLLFGNYNAFALSLSFFDHSFSSGEKISLSSIANDYKPQGEGFLNGAAFALKFIEEMRYGTPRSKFHFYLGTRELFDFAPNSFIATLDHDFDRFYPSRRLSFYSSFNSDKFDWDVFLDDITLKAKGSLWGGLRLALAPFKAYGFETGAGVYANLVPIGPVYRLDLLPFADIGFPIADNSSTKITLIFSYIRGAMEIKPFEKFMVEGRLSMSFLKGNLGLDLALAYNRGRRFSSTLNDTQALVYGGYFDLGQSAFDTTSLDLIFKGKLILSKYFSVFGLADIPMNLENGRIPKGSSEGLNSDIETFKLGWNSPQWGINLKYSIQGLSTRLTHLFKGPEKPSQALMSFVDSRNAVLSLEGFFNLNLARFDIEAGFDTKGGKTEPTVSLSITLDLSKDSLKRKK